MVGDIRYERMNLPAPHITANRYRSRPGILMQASSTCRRNPAGTRRAAEYCPIMSE
ncbi:MAG: hypothetical protein OXI27_10600 [Thaumarchaeota archaeon]|nr:hypothetical protein [Nitrososphaerota archaeon]